MVDSLQVSTTGDRAKGSCVGVDWIGGDGCRLANLLGSLCLH